MTPEQARYLRGLALRFALDRFHENQRAADTSGGLNTRRDKVGSGKRIIQGRG
jgi:hypothetical protein